MAKLTLVTALLDIRRGDFPELEDAFRRPISSYVQHFRNLLRTPLPMVVITEKKFESLVWEIRSENTTQVILKEPEQLRQEFAFFEMVDDIRQRQDWRAQATWLTGSPQATLEFYNPLVMSKMFWLHDASITNPHHTDFFCWIDGGICSTVSHQLLCNPDTWDGIEDYLEKFLFLTFPYEGAQEIHGFARESMNKFAGVDSIDWVCRGGFFGGHKRYIREANTLYYRVLESSLSQGLMGTEESIFTLMAHLEPKSYERFLIGENGLVQPFFESLRKKTLETVKLGRPNPQLALKNKIALYILSFNSPEQFEMTIQTWQSQDGFVDLTENYLINNSTDSTHDEAYQSLCKRYGFEELRKQNIGISGGRQFAAEHFETTDCALMLYLEDDMLLHGGQAATCKCGFASFTDELLRKSCAIVLDEELDFLKLSYSEFFGNNGQQWAWYNVSSETRQEVWPNKPMPSVLYSAELPATRIERLGVLEGLSYAVGEVYYCNWPQLVSRRGNQRLFLDSVEPNPSEAVWMRNAFDLVRKQELKAAVLLLSPVLHKRIHHYPAEDRKES